jgi:hypothetical protein
MHARLRNDEPGIAEASAAAACPTSCIKPSHTPGMSRANPETSASMLPGAALFAPAKHLLEILGGPNLEWVYRFGDSLVVL